MKSAILAVILGLTTTCAAAGPLPEEDLGEMAAGRQRLEAVHAPGLRASHPELAARAESSFECWTSGIEGLHTASAACRDEFMVAVAALERAREQEGGGLIAAQ